MLQNKNSERLAISRSQANQGVAYDTLLIAIFGALWGLMEITVGVALKGLRLPLSGVILAALAAIIFLSGRYFVPRRGAILMMGAIAAMMKVLSVGTVIAGPFMAIMIEAAIGELFISLLGISRWSYVFTAATLLIYTPIHPFIAQGLIFGTNIYSIYLETFNQIGRILHIDSGSLWLIVGGYILFHAVVGATAGWIAFSVARRVQKEVKQIHLIRGNFR